MKKMILYLSFALILLSITGCNALEERKAEKKISNYYDALIDKEYKKAFKQLHLYDDYILDSVTTFSTEEAEQRFMGKIDFLIENGYQLIDYKILEVEYEDGHSFWHHVRVRVELDGETFEFNEVADIWEGKLIVSSKDPYIDYRNGKMNVQFE